ncbi:MAG: leucine--tRNA ligase [Candidatus Zixiibacteriota bacterium]
MYNFKEIEKKWKKYWDEIELYKTPEDFDPKDKFYLLEMYAYPSGDLHIGHLRNYSVGDAIWRKKRMEGKKLLHPFGWDAFGLPAEEAAIKHGKSPEEWTLANIKKSKDTLKKLSISYDWDREVATCFPDYYKWTQWVFLKLYEKGLAYQDEAVVNWCPKCMTVLANEQIEQGQCWRCDSEVQKKKLKQWFIKITDYAQRLLDDLELLKGGWPENIIAMQKNWIGRSEGAEIVFEIEATGDKLPVFTTRPDTVYGVTFMTIAPEHKLIDKLLEHSPNRKEVEDYVQKALKKSELERSFTDREADGVNTGLFVINPFNGDKIQLWVGDYVLASYGTGTVMAVPAHDYRDFNFAKKYDIPIKVVINPKDSELSVDDMEEAFTEHGIMVNSGPFDGTDSLEGISRVAEYAKENGFGGPTVSFKLRDWLISRQRYWGAPIPIVHCEKCGTVAVPEDDLPIKLPEADKVDFIPKGRSPLADVPNFMNVKCPKCGGDAVRDADTMDTFVCSSWYMLRYPDANNDKIFAEREKLDRWMPVDFYIGGAEHATGHLLYFRFITKVLHDMGYVGITEPAKKLFNQGMVMDEKGDIMSKSKGNVIAPGPLSEKIGVDGIRVATFFFAPADRDILWSEKAVKGVVRFLDKIWNTFTKIKVDKTKSFDNTDNLSDSDMAMLKKLHQTIEKYVYDFEKLQFNTCIAAMMEFMNEVDIKKLRASAISYYIMDTFNRMLAPFAPHLAEEQNSRLGYDGTVFDQPFPDFDPKLVREDSVTYAVSVMGKLRGTLDAPKGAMQEDIEPKAKVLESVARHLEGKKIIKVIFVQDKIINFVAK